MQTRRKAPLWFIHCLMLVAATLVATSFIVGAAITHGMEPAVLTLVRFLAAIIFFTPYIYWRYGRLHFGLSLFFRCAVISASIVLFFYCMFLALRTTTALNTSVLFTLVPGISGIYSAALLRERLGRQRIFALLCAMSGALWVIFRGDIDRLIAFDVNRGDLVFLAGCLSMAFYTPLVRLLHRGEKMDLMTYWVLVTGSIWLLLLSGTQLYDYPFAAVRGEIWAGILYLAVFTTIVTFFLTQFATIHLGPTRVMAYSYFYPALVLLFEKFLLGKNPPVSTYPGIAIIGLAIYFVQRGVVYDKVKMSRY